MQGLAFDDDDNLWASEFGESTYDELNLIRKGGNYGWPEVEGRGDEEGLVNPRVVWSTGQASPSGLAYAEGHLWLGSAPGHPALAGRRRRRRGQRPDAVLRRRVRPAAHRRGRAPDGMLWVTTSNRDGRGDPAAEDDRILVVRPGTR